MIDPNPDKGAQVKITPFLPQGVCINTDTKKEEPYYDSDCNDDNRRIYNGIHQIILTEII